MRLGETCVVAATFQEARHFTPVDRAALPRARRADGLRLRDREDLPVEPLPGLRGADLRPDDVVRGEWDVVVLGPHFSAALLARDLGDDGPGPGAHLRVRPHLRPGDRRPGGARAAVAGRPAGRAGRLRSPRSARPATAADVALAAVPLDGDALLRSALSATTSGVTIADMRRPDQPLIYVNEAFEELAGFPSAEVLGRNCRFLQSPDTDPAAVARIRAAIDRGEECRETVLNLRGPDRTPWWNEIHLAPVFDAAGTVVQYIGVQHDVTARVEAERALLQERDRNQAFLARIEELAYTDPLTGLPNRRRLEERVETAIWSARAGATPWPCCSSTSTASRRSTTASGTRPATNCCSPWPAPCAAGCAAPTCWPGSGGDEFLVALTGLDPATAARGGPARRRRAGRGRARPGRPARQPGGRRSQRRRRGLPGRRRGVRGVAALGRPEHVRAEGRGRGPRADVRASRRRPGARPGTAAGRRRSAACCPTRRSRWPRRGRVPCGVATSNGVRGASGAATRPDQTTCPASGSKRAASAARAVRGAAPSTVTVTSPS